ncbi:hypothetical protein NNJEOMEG_03068 [Fundidesulfovibrio magnetotacticus]|uniref:ABM domain-containing protein n=1 Tax=Fundidesulfovibrio magnetotacticus TaxID=2730080 RepID=A0A6V8LWD8_9BACT|nr:antibiotic biosynthesis monooxygenase [Fundidesulfovibrio magnetotacticus]GFK95210.1 hypothetical protein NNJEOMEG_03068 [Fundidesulfovibrio magnetotacticus]
MIARRWSCRCPLDTLPDFLDHLRATGVAETSALPGFLGHQTLLRELAGEAEVTLVTYWRDMESVRAFAGGDPGRARLYPGDEKFRIAPDLEVRHERVIEWSGAPQGADQAKRS